jgi:hypothetical protein
MENNCRVWNYAKVQVPEKIERINAGYNVMPVKQKSWDVKEFLSINLNRGSQPNIMQVWASSKQVKTSSL